MCDLKGRLNSLKAEISKEKQKSVEELQAEKILKLCERLEQLMADFINNSAKNRQ